MNDLKHVLILGGSGTLGVAIIEHLKINFPHVKVTVGSRSEHKHADLKKKYPHVKFILCDIRDADATYKICHRQDLVFHVAALKHVDILEDNPVESIKTNVVGTLNVANACSMNGVRWCMFSSTDKAVEAENVYGHCKALSESVLLDFNNKQLVTRFQVFRWGNVIGSQGSAIPYFIKCIHNETELNLTDTRMTRFWIRIEEAVEFMIGNHKNISNSVLIPPFMKGASVSRIINTLEFLLEKKAKINIVGLRRGEKIDESLISQHSRFPLNSRKCQQYTDDELKGLLFPLTKEFLKNEGL